MDNEYTVGAKYRVITINLDRERVPDQSFYNTVEGEQHIFYSRDKYLSTYHVMKAFEANKIKKNDKVLLCILAAFGGVLERTTLTDLMYMAGNKNILGEVDKLFNKLRKMQLINISVFKDENDELTTWCRIVSLTSYGSRVVSALGFHHYYDPMKVAVAQSHKIKSDCAVARLVCNWLKRYCLDDFEVHPLRIRDAKSGAIVRAGACIKLWGEELYFEAPRRHDGYMAELMDKLNRYDLVFEDAEKPTIVICGEDIEMNREIFKALLICPKKVDVMFTDIPSTYGAAFNTSIYTFNEQLEQIRFSIKND